MRLLKRRLRVTGRRETAGRRGFAATAGALICFTIVAASSARVQAAREFEDVPVPGGIGALAAALGLDAPPDRSRFASEIMRVAYDASETNPRIDAWLRSLRSSVIPPAWDEADVVPVPLSAAFWSDAVFRTKVGAADLLPAILADRRAALLCHGLAALDDETLAFFAAHSALVRRIYERDATAFAVFSAGLRIHDGRVVVPGAALARSGATDAAVPLWEAIVGEPVSRPERFVAALFARDGGRAAYLYDAVAHLDPPHARFALGLWMPGDALRLERFSALARSSDAAFREWRIRTLPFSRPVYDVASVLDRVRVSESGAPATPSSRAFWRAALASGRFDHAAPAVAGDENPIDAAWLGEMVSGPLHQRTDRFGQLSFGQRVFGSIAADQVATAASIVSAYPRFEMLLLTLERIGVADPQMYAAALRAAGHLGSLEGKRGFAALAQFQGALAIVARMVRVRSLDAGRARHGAFGVVLAPVADRRLRCRDGRMAQPPVS